MVRMVYTLPIDVALTVATGGSFGAAKYGAAKYGGKTLKGTLSNVEARKWYLVQERMIPKMINRSASLKRQAKQVFKLRNKARTRARELMADRDLARQLDQIDPNLSWREIIEKTKSKGFKGDDIYKEIINSSQRSRTGVNEKLGVNRWLK